MKFRLFFIGLSFFSFVLLRAQSHPKDEWGNVSPEELKMTVYEPDTSAGAVVLLDKGEIVIDFEWEYPEVVFRHYRRIKILKPSGFKRGNVSILYRKSWRWDENLTGLKAQVVMPSGKIIPVPRSAIFTDEITEYIHEKKIAFPNVDEGVVLEYYYTVRSKSFRNLHEWYFQDYIPVVHSELTVAIPEYMEYLMLYQGAKPLKKLKWEEKKEMYFIEAQGEVPDLKLARSLVTADFGINNFVFTLRNIPAFQPNPSLITTARDYIAHMRFQWSALYNPITDKVYHLMSSWKDLGKHLYAQEEFGRDIFPGFYPPEMEVALQEPLSKAQTARDTFEAVWEYLQRHIHMSKGSGYGYWMDEGPKKLFKKSKSHAGAQNMMLIGALRHLGYEAWPVLISTRSHGTVYKEYPFDNQFNHAVALVKLGRDSVFVDLSTSFHPPGYLPVDMLNRYGYLIDEEGGRWVDIPAPRSEEIFIGDFYIDEETLDLYGSLDCHFRGYAAFDQLKAVLKESDPEAYWARWLQSKYPDAEIDSVAFEEPERFAERMSVRFYVRFPEMVEELGDMWSVPFISPAELDENPLRAEESKVDISLAYPFKEKTIMDLHLPEGMEIVSVPESVKINLPNRGGRALCIVTAGGGKIKRMETLQVNQTEFTPEEYGSLRDFFSLYFDRDAEPILLR
ncbi:MAG TPA: DUF3857 domain-containing protein [Phaeodactylibacter sp.]|nr:DUF3857 domain-containing protein [Phaeodactylibacter sp.]